MAARIILAAVFIFAIALFADGQSRQKEFETWYLLRYRNFGGPALPVDCLYAVFEISSGPNVNMSYAYQLPNGTEVVQPSFEAGERIFPGLQYRFFIRNGGPNPFCRIFGFRLRSPRVAKFRSTCYFREACASTERNPSGDVLAELNDICSEPEFEPMSQNNCSYNFRNTVTQGATVINSGSAENSGELNDRDVWENVPNFRATRAKGHSKSREGDSRDDDRSRDDDSRDDDRGRDRDDDRDRDRSDDRDRSRGKSHSREKSRGRDKDRDRN